MKRPTHKIRFKTASEIIAAVERLEKAETPRLYIQNKKDPTGYIRKILTPYWFVNLHSDLTVSDTFEKIRGKKQLTDDDFNTLCVIIYVISRQVRVFNSSLSYYYKSFFCPVLVEDIVANDVKDCEAYINKGLSRWLSAALFHGQFQLIVGQDYTKLFSQEFKDLVNYQERDSVSPSKCYSNDLHRTFARVYRHWRTEWTGELTDETTKSLKKLGIKKAYISESVAVLFAIDSLIAASNRTSAAWQIYNCQPVTTQFLPLQNYAL